MLRGELLGFALVRHDLGISDTASNYLSQEQTTRENIMVRNWDESNGAGTVKKKKKKKISRCTYLWTIQFGIWGAIRVADTQRYQSGWVRVRLELASETGVASSARCSCTRVFAAQSCGM